MGFVREWILLLQVCYHQSSSSYQSISPLHFSAHPSLDLSSSKTNSRETQSLSWMNDMTSSHSQSQILLKMYLRVTKPPRHILKSFILSCCARPGTVSRLLKPSYSLHCLSVMYTAKYEFGHCVCVRAWWHFVLRALLVW